MRANKPGTSRMSHSRKQKRENMRNLSGPFDDALLHEALGAGHGVFLLGQVAIVQQFQPVPALSTILCECV